MMPAMRRTGNVVAAGIAGSVVVAAAVVWLLWPEGETEPPDAGPVPARPASSGAAVPAPFPPGGGATPDADPVRPLSALPLPAALREERLPEERGAGVVAGSVVEEATRQPIAGARVSLHHPQGAFDLVAASGEDGTFAIEGVPPVRGAWLRAAAAGFAPRWVREVDLAAGERIDAGAIGLERGPALRGRVVDPARRPVAGAQLLLLPGNAPANPFTDYDLSTILKEVFGESRALDAAASAADGAFVFPCVGPGQYVVAARKPGLQVRYSDALMIRAGMEAPILELVLHAGRRVAGSVKDEGGAPVAGALVAAMDQEAAFTSGFKTEKRTTDAGGRFAFDMLGPVQLNLLVRATGFAAQARMVDTRETGPIDIVMRRGARIAGRVFDQVSGAGIAGVPVIAISFGDGDGIAESSTDAEGRYEIASGPSGKEINLLVRAPGYTPAAGISDRESPFGEQHIAIGELAPGSEVRQDVPMLGGASVSGRVVDADTGAGIAGAEVRESRGGFFGGGGTSVVTTSGADGAFTLAPVGAGKFRLQAKKEGWYSEADRARGNPDTGEEPPDPRLLVAAAGQKIEGREVSLRRGLDVAGRVVDERGKAVAGAEVNAAADQASGRDGFFFDMVRGESVITDASGRFLVSGLPRSPVTFQAFHPDHPAGGETGCDLGAGAPPDLQIVVSRGGSVAGELLLPDNLPAAGYRLAFEPKDGKVVERKSFWALRGRLEAETDGDGRFRLDGLPLGRGLLKLAPWNQPADAYVGANADGEQRLKWILEPQGTEVFLRTGEIAEAHLLLRAPLAISGTVAFEDGMPVLAALIMARGEAGGDGVMAEVRPDGGFEVSGLASGRYLIEVLERRESGTEALVTAGPFEAGASGIRIAVPKPK